jgi:hypothetical protein
MDQRAWSSTPEAWPALGVLAAVHPDDGAIRHRLEDILSRSEFHPEDQNKFWQRLLQYIGDFIEWLRGLQTTAPALFWLIIISLIVLLVLVLTHMTWTVAKVLGLSDRPARAEDQKEKRSRLSAIYRQEAARRAEQGDFTEAIRFLFLSLVYRFDEAGRVSFQKAYTNREYLTLFHDRPAVQHDLAVFVDTLDDHWYGQRPTDRGRYENCLALYETLK